MSTSSIKRRIGRFHVVVVQWTSEKCTKKRDSRAEQSFCSYNQLLFDVVVIAKQRALSIRKLETAANGTEMSRKSFQKFRKMLNF